MKDLFLMLLMAFIALLITFNIIQFDIITDDLDYIHERTSQLSDMHQCLIDISHHKQCAPLDY
jgi:hypothetical protein